MNKTLSVQCESISCATTEKRGEDTAHIKMTLEDVRIFELMQSLIKEVGVEVILDHITNTQIENYLKGNK